MKKHIKLIYILIGVMLIGWIGYRVYSIYHESRREVFNAARASAAPADTMVAVAQLGVLREPLFIKNNQAYVSGSRVHKFGIGQKVGEQGRIISVSGKVDLDTGMYQIKTAGAADGEQFAEQKYNGFFIPASAVRDGKIMIIKNKIAVAQDVKIVNRDSENVLIQYGLNDGDVIVLSRVAEGTRVIDGVDKND